MANIVEQDGLLKETLVNYVGNKVNPDNDEVTIEMVVDILAAEFPELVLALAEENWVNGYTQALTDVEYMKNKDDSEEIHKE